MFLLEIHNVYEPVKGTEKSYNIETYITETYSFVLALINYLTLGPLF